MRLFQSCGIHPSLMAFFKNRAKGLDARFSDSITICRCISSCPSDLFKPSVSNSFQTISPSRPFPLFGWLIAYIPFELVFFDEHAIALILFLTLVNCWRSFSVSETLSIFFHDIDRLCSLHLLRLASRRTWLIVCYASVSTMASQSVVLERIYFVVYKFSI